MATILTLIPKPNGSTSDPAVIIPGGDKVNYGRLRASTLQFRDTLRIHYGVKTGDIVGMSLTNSMEFVIAFLAAGSARAIAAPFNPAYSVPEFQFYLSDTMPTIFILPKLTPQNQLAHTALEAAKKEGIRAVEFWIEDGAFQHKVAYEGKGGNVKNGNDKANHDFSDPTPDDVALLLHTSGTTGRPKAVPLSHRNLLRTTTNIVNTYNMTAADRTYLVMPLFHVHGLMCGLLSSLRAGSSVVIPPRFSATQFWSDFIGYRCNWWTAVPTIHTILLSSPVPANLPKIRFIRSCSSALPPVTFNRLEKTFKAPVLEAYAMTEAAHQMTSNVVESRLPGSVGIGIGVEISIRDENGNEVFKGHTGEVCARGENVTNGYWNNEKANKESFFDGRWFRTGDQGLILPGGQLQLTGRIKELINRGGEKLAPLEIDAAILSVEGVLEAVCFGVDDPKYGEVVWAGVVLKPGYGGNDENEEERIRKALEGTISKFKIPEKIIITKAIPKTATGKVQRRHARDVFIKQVRAKGALARL